jgi:hypothetical protein
MMLLLLLLNPTICVLHKITCPGQQLQQLLCSWRCTKPGPVCQRSAFFDITSLSACTCTAYMLLLLLRLLMLMLMLLQNLTIDFYPLPAAAAERHHFCAAFRSPVPVKIPK